MEINCDVGELSREIDDAILPWVDACNVCCGAHAGDTELITGTIREAIRLGVVVGAHPSWPDRENFGRRSMMDLSVEQLRDSLYNQIIFVKDLVEAEGGELRHVKPHGALYHDVLHREKLASCFKEVVCSVDPGLSIYGMAGSEFGTACEAEGIGFVQEAFGDRRYESGDRLRSRDQDDALIDNEADFKTHLQQLLSGTVVDVHGTAHPLTVDTICIHSDTPHAVKFAKLAHAAIKS